MDCWIVTGGAGFIGSNFVRLALARTDARVVVLDKLTYAGSLLSLADFTDHPRFHFVEADIADRATVDQVFRDHRPTAVLNFAAETHVDRSIDGPAAFIQTNVVGTFELLDAAREQLDRIDPAARERFRFLHVSTDEVYGSLGPAGAFTEITPYDPNSPYSASKAGADHIARAYFSTYGLPAIITNCSNNYGPYQFPEKLIPLMILNALEGRPLPVYGDGLYVRDWIYVEDHCAGILEVLRRGRPGEKYNLGGESERTNLEVLARLCEAVESERPAVDNPALNERGLRSYNELVTFVEDRSAHDRRYAIDSSKIRDELDWRPAHDFENGIVRTVQWYLQNSEWCSTVQRNAAYQRERLGLTT